MIQAMYNQRFEVVDRPPGQTAAGSADFAALFGEATDTSRQGAVLSSAPASSLPDPTSTSDTAPSSLGDPNVQGFLNSYCAEAGVPSDANNSYQPAVGAGNDYRAGSVYGPDQIYAQALQNQIGNCFAILTGGSAANYTSQLPGIPSAQVQKQFDQQLAYENLQRLASGQPIDTSAYWSDPGSLSLGGKTYTSQELGYAGPGQSSGPQPIFLSTADQVPGTNNYYVPGYSGTVTGLKPERFYTLQELEQAGLPAGQPNTQVQPGSWTLTQGA